MTSRELEQRIKRRDFDAHSKRIKYQNGKKTRKLTLARNPEEQ